MDELISTCLNQSPPLPISLSTLMLLQYLIFITGLKILSALPHFYRYLYELHAAKFCY